MHATVYFCYKFYATRLVVMKNKNLLPQSATLLGSGLRWPFLFESVGLAIHVFPGIDGGASVATVVHAGASSCCDAHRASW